MKNLNETHLHAYQNRCVKHMMENDCSGLFLEMGLGKTVSTLTTINKLMFEELSVSGVLVIAPKRVAETVWSGEIAKWDHLKHLTYSRISGTVKQRKAAIKDKVDIHIIGRDLVEWLCAQFGGDFLPWDMLVIDESSSFKNPKSKRFMALRWCLSSFKRVVILTGTPSPNGLKDIWSQIFLLDHGARLGKSFSTFKMTYFRNTSFNPQFEKLEVNKGGSEMVYDKIKDICISMKAEDYLTLPGRVNNYIDIEFPPKIQKAYDDFEQEQILAMFEDTEITAVNAAALMIKLLQFANGAVYEDLVYDLDDEGVARAQPRVYHEVHNLKIKALEEILESANGNPVLLAWTYRHDLYRIEKHLAKYKPRRLVDGDDIEAWNRGEVPFMLMHPATGAHGLNLQAGGHTIVWFGQTWSLELYQQFNARLDRQGQENVTMIHHLLCNKTIDHRVIKALENKTSGQNELFDAVKAKIQKYLK